MIIHLGEGKVQIGIVSNLKIPKKIGLTFRPTKEKHPIGVYVPKNKKLLINKIKDTDTVIYISSIESAKVLQKMVNEVVFMFSNSEKKK